MTRDGGIVLGHNTMTSYTTADCNLVLEIVPREGHRILMQGSPGWIHSGTDFFVTDAGLVGSETTISGFKGFDEKGVPEFVRMRRATQDAATIDEWCAIMRKGNNGGYANGWLIGDVKTGEIARLELGLKHVGFERTKDGYFVGSNLAENVQILRLETDQDETDIRVSDVARRVRWKQLMKENHGQDRPRAREGVRGGPPGHVPRGGAARRAVALRALGERDRRPGRGARSTRRARWTRRSSTPRWRSAWRSRRAGARPAAPRSTPPRSWRSTRSSSGWRTSSPAARSHRWTEFRAGE